MTRLPKDSVRTVAFAIAVCLLPATAIASEPEPGAAQTDGTVNLGGFEKSIPMAIGGVITVTVLALGFVLLNSKRPESRTSADWEITGEQLPPDVVAGANPLRYLVTPAIVLALMAVFVPLGLSIWKNMPDVKLPVPPTNGKVDLNLNSEPVIDWSKMKPIEMPKGFEAPKSPVIPVPAPIPVAPPPHFGRHR